MRGVCSWPRFVAQTAHGGKSSDLVALAGVMRDSSRLSSQELKKLDGEKSPTNELRTQGVSEKQGPSLFFSSLSTHAAHKLLWPQEGV